MQVLSPAMDLQCSHLSVSVHSSDTFGVKLVNSEQVFLALYHFLPSSDSAT